MTAEIGILNRMGVALAADSAVTIGGSAETQKVYNSANKLFSLSKFHPVGIMIYGNANYMGVPWETVIKTYRSVIGDTKFPTLFEYCQSFFDFIKSDSRLITKAAESERVKEVFNYFLLDILNKVNENLSDIQPTEEMVLDEIDKITKLILTSLEESDLLDGFDREFYQEFIQLHKNDILEMVDHNIFIELPENVYERLLEISTHVFSKDFFYESTGVVIAGYGEDEIFPSLYDFKIDGIYCGRFKYKTGKATIISSAEETDEDKTTASIRPFAQREMVSSFMEGIDPLLNKIIFDSLTDVFLEFPDVIEKNIEKKFTEEEKEIIKETGREALKKFNELLREVRSTKFTDPIVDVVEVLPKEELAAMAEALVNLTSFKRKITRDTETVGGPIDVAVISKGDGFIWIKRKHYFKPDLNYHFFQNYLRGE
jgi:hypothetical protein